MSGLDSIVEYQGFYDFLNHIISGSIFIIGSEIIAKMFNFSLIQAAYEFIGLWPVALNEFMWNVCVILLFVLISFLIGVAVQELYSKIYEHKRIFGLKSNQSGRKPISSNKGCTFTPASKSTSKNIVVTLSRTLLRLVIKTTIQDCMKNLLTADEPISNEYKRKRYSELAELFAEQFAHEAGENKLAVMNDDMVSYFFAYCVYYIQIKNQNRKTEKLRDIEGLSKELSLVFLFLTFFAIIAFFITLFQFNGDKWYLAIIYSILCAYLSIIMDFRTEKSIKNRIRMTLAIYDVEKRKEEISSYIIKRSSERAAAE